MRKVNPTPARLWPAAAWVGILAGHVAAADAPANHGRFYFGAGAPPAGFQAVATNSAYSDAAGFGFEPGAAPAATPGAMTAAHGFQFSVRLPEGNYAVTATLGGGATAAETTVNAELRRLMVERVRTPAGGTETRKFIVNVRQPHLPTGGVVRLTEREKTAERRAWDDRLTLEFLGVNPAVAALEIAPVEVPTVFLIGDSTVCDQPTEPYNSWGQMLPRFFQPTVAVANHAESGESLAGALAKGRFNKIWSQFHAGDYLIVQFGHNDMKSTAADALEKYTENLRRVVAEARKRGGQAILCTPVSRRSFGPDGKIENSFRGYPEAVRLVAREENVPLLDLQQMGAALYEALGPEGSHRAFATAREGTHHGNYGSYEIAQCVLQALRQNQVPLARQIVPEFTGFDPAHPDSAANFRLPTGHPAAAVPPPPGN